MAILQDKLSEIRYIKRKNLNEESRIIANYYRDIIHQYGIDCNYYKLKTNYPNQFKTSIDQNNLILHAYGYDVDPDYSISAKMITYMEVENDIFNLNKYGIIPNADVNFYFDATEFACNLAVKLGKLKEFKIASEQLSIYFGEDELGDIKLEFPFYSEVLSGIVNFPIDDLSVELGKPINIIGEILSRSDPKWTFPVNEHIIKSFDYVVRSDNMETIMMTADIVINAVDDPDELSAGHDYVMIVKTKGTVLFHDVNAISKYRQHIIPNVGDVITIDFPDDHNRERYEITECIDKQLTPDGINPLLHKYVWKCKARRYANGQENFPEQNDADKQMSEKQDLINTAGSLVGDAIDIYNDNEDKVYGGYKKVEPPHDITDVKGMTKKLWKVVNDGTLIDLMWFGNHSKLVTNGYDLYFVPNNSEEVTLVNLTSQKTEIDKYIKTKSDLKFLKANDYELVFINVEGEVYKLVTYKEVPPELVKMCLDSMLDLSLYSNGMEDVNNAGENYYKFSNCNTVLVSTGDHLLCCFGNKKVLRIV